MRHLGIVQTAVLFLISSGTLFAFEAAPVRDHDIVPEDYFGIGTVLSAEISPDGRLAAYVESRWGEGQEGRMNDLWVADLESGRPLRLTFDGFGAGGPKWGADSETIYFGGRCRRSGAQKPPYNGTYQVFRIAATGGEPFPVTRAAEGVGSFCLGRDGRYLYYTTSEKVHDEEWKALQTKFSDLEYGHGITELNPVFRLDLVTWRAEKVFEAKRVIHEMALSPDGRKIAMITTLDNELIFKEGWSKVEVLDLASRAVEEVTPLSWRKDHPSPYGWLEGLAWSGDAGALAFGISYDGYASRIYVAEWKDGPAQLFEIERPGILAFDGGLTWRGEERTLCYRGEEKARLRAYAVQDVRDGSQGKTRPLTPGDWVMGPYSFNDSGEVMVAVMETTTHLNDLYTLKGDRLERVIDLNPQVATWKLPQISIRSWTGADGDPVEGILELPPGYEKGDGPLPLIVELHGGPTASTKFRLRLWIYGRALMPAKGYALLSPNYHGSTGYGDLFTSKLIGRENAIEVEDICAGIDALVEAGLVDRDRMGVMGWSNGGFLTNAMITSRPDLFKAASSGAGVLDMVLQWGIEDTPGHVINYMEGLPWENPEAYREGSPLYSLGRVKTPTLIHVGGNDARVPAAHSKTLYRALRHYLNVPVELVIYPGEGHGLSTHENRLAKMEWDLAWFDRYLLGKKDQVESPSK